MSHLSANIEQTQVAYFSMEIGINPKLPTYSGGLGILAGDILRGCADLRQNVVGVTLLYRKGYFQQTIDESGNQQEHEVHWNPADLLQKLDHQVSIFIEEREVKIQAWAYELEGVTGHDNLILFLDTDLPENSDYDRSLTNQLYGKDSYYRLCQEMVLGLGGARMLEKVGFENIQNYHMNEGHSALLSLELYRRFKDRPNPREQVRSHCVFTTHTTVPAGHDSFENEMASKALGTLLEKTGLNLDDLLHEGKLNMTHLALQFSGYVNGVAKIHRDVSRLMFPNYHIESITNGIHAGFWVSDPLADVFDQYLPDWREDPAGLRLVLNIPKHEIWEAHQESKRKFFQYLQKKYHVYLSEEVLTIGFARRAATYKRGDMLLQDVDRLRRLASRGKGLQIIYGGKAHPNDGLGKEVIRRIVGKIRELQDVVKVCYVENFDMEVAKMMVPGVDVWLNTPMRPKEASGTSGMKAAVNGVPQFSTLDGWWLEGHIEGVTGWSIGSEPNNRDQESQISDVDDLYNKLEYVLMPTYYQEQDKWQGIMRNSIALNGSYFNVHRVVQDYMALAYRSDMRN